MIIFHNRFRRDRQIFQHLTDSRIQQPEPGIQSQFNLAESNQTRVRHPAPFHSLQRGRIDQCDLIPGFKRKKSPCLRMPEFQQQRPFFLTDHAQINPVNVDRIVLRSGKTAVRNSHLSPAAGNLYAVGKRGAYSAGIRRWGMNVMVDVQIPAKLGDNAETGRKAQFQMIQFNIAAVMQENTVFIADGIPELPYAVRFDLCRLVIREYDMSRIRFPATFCFRSGMKPRPQIA